jgi:hypothetical protein
MGVILPSSLGIEICLGLGSKFVVPYKNAKIGIVDVSTISY